MAFTDSVAALKTAVEALIAKFGPAAVTAAVAAKDATDAAAVDALTTEVNAALNPPTA